MDRFPELTRLARDIKQLAIKEKIPAYTPGLLLVLVHWYVFPLFLIYACLVSEDAMIIAMGLTICVMTGAVQSVYSARCPLIYIERELLDCKYWWRGLPFTLLVAYVQPIIILWGTGIGLVRFIVNMLN
jgi:hypothetical protein